MQGTTETSESGFWENTAKDDHGVTGMDASWNPLILFNRLNKRKKGVRLAVSG